MCAVPDCFDKSETCRSAYCGLVEFLDQFLDVATQEKKQSAHFASGGTAFLGAHPRRDGIRLTIVLNKPLEGDRIVKSEQTSKNRFHNEVDLKGGSAIDPELATWIGEAYNLHRLIISTGQTA